MKKAFEYLLILALCCFWGNCSKEDDPAATLTLSKETVELASTANSTASVELNSNQTVFSVLVNKEANTWCSAVVTGKTVTVTATSDNSETVERTAIVTVKAGKGKNAIARSFTVVQSAGFIQATLSLTAEEVTLPSAINSTAVVEAISNQTMFQAIVSEAAVEWCSVSVTENVLLIKALSENTSGETRTAVITVIAGTGTNTASKEIVVNQLSPSPSIIGQVTEGGVVFWQDPENPKRCKIVSATRLEGEPWCPDEIAAIPTGANSLDDGIANTNVIKALENFEQYVAVKYCTDMGEGWYLPSRNELLLLFEAYNGTKISDATLANPNEITPAEKTAREAFDAALISLPNGVALNTAADNSTGNSIWSSTEHATDPTKVYWVRFGKYAVDAGVKRSTARTVRAVKIITAN